MCHDTGLAVGGSERTVLAGRGTESAFMEMRRDSILSELA